MPKVLLSINLSSALVVRVYKPTSKLFNTKLEAHTYTSIYVYIIIRWKLWIIEVWVKYDMLEAL